jgi:chromate reductase
LIGDNLFHLTSSTKARVNCYSFHQNTAVVNTSIKKIVAFGASTSKQSINKKFASYAAGFFAESDIKILDLNDYEVTLYSIDREKSDGIPQKVVLFYHDMKEADLLIISLAEHNGSYTAAFKNLFDWVTRYVNKCWENQKLFLLSTSPGLRGGKSVMEAALVRFPIHGAEILDHFSLPGFNQHFTTENGIINEELYTTFSEKVNAINRLYGLDNH